ncbi:hypothetical protein U14_03347 [Candidatus Moduliflexus flocculans]|uniref:Uncharacterized protein n=1 Tax=Candidatus Moduliflexus flocculans TaxID=1499966 RepID=A0A081BNY2_9BACT|nr:hypothetical protein U14_03347 [Candidatus Moduliflexus flocculans]
MALIRKTHRTSQEALKALLLTSCQQHRLKPTLKWPRDFAFETSALGTTVRGEILEHELVVEISGLFAKRAMQELHERWERLELQGIV